MRPERSENAGGGHLRSPSSSPENNLNKTSICSNNKNSIEPWDTSPIATIFLKVSMWLLRRPLVSLSMLWILLCSGLVWKYHELSCVFFAFCSSFALAYTFQTMSSFLPVVNPSSSSLQICIKALVGVTACALQWYYLLDPLSTTLSNEERTRDVIIGDAISDTTSCCHKALSVAAGYLAFDHWHWALYLQNQKSLWHVVEDTVTLIIFIIVLVCMAMLRRRPQHEQRELLDMETTVQTVLSAWTLIKLCRFGSILVSRGHPVLKEQRQQHKNECNETTVKPLGTLLREFKPASTEYSAVATGDRCWIIHGVEYDLSTYVDQHPGGREAILLGQGRDDCTAVFQSYHPFSASQATQILRKYRRVLPKSTSTARPTTHENRAVPRSALRDLFYETLCQRVAQTLRQKHQFDPIRDRAATTSRALYYGLVVTAAVMSGIAHSRGSILGSFLLAVFGWLIGSLGHDAGHFAASRRPWINDVGVWAMSLLCNPIMWQHQHTFAHHSHTNSFDHDPDLHHFVTFLRVHRRFQQSDLYKYQSNRFFVFFAYTFVVFGTCFWIPWGMIKEGSLYRMVEWTDRRRPWRTTGLILHLMAYTGFIFLLPFWVHASWLAALIAIAVHVATSGLLFAIFSQINHLNEGSLDFDTKCHAKRDPALNQSWAVKQIETSNNFCPDSTLWHILSNGLNLQIEHHLFPGLNHCHLHLIQPTVQAVCQEYGVKYKSYASWSELMHETLAWLERLSTEAVLEET